MIATATDRLAGICDLIEETEALLRVVIRYATADPRPAGAEPEDLAAALKMGGAWLERAKDETRQLRADLANGTQELIHIEN